MRKPFRTQVDLFATAARPVELTPIDHQKAVALLQVLLTEAVATASADVPSTVGKREAGNE
ncbi:MAG TPA: hypothetical protein PLD10_24605 [Rhodopila sp.]|nr:hypothetical protein [Rhodopila sp.]